MAMPQTKQELRDFSRVDVAIITHLHAVSDDRLLEAVEQVFPIQLDKKLRTMLNWAVNDYGVFYTAAMEFYLVEWFKALAEEPQAQQDMRKAYPHLPEFHVSFYIGKHLTWIKAKGV
jgi:hypothetical protein